MGSAMKGLALGVLAGALWSGAEAVMQWAGGSLIPTAVAREVAIWNLGVAAVAGLVLGAVVLQRGGSIALAMALLGVYGFLRVYAPPGYMAEGLFVLVTAATTVLVTLAAGTDRDGVLPFVHTTVLGVVAMALFEIAFNESHAVGLKGLRLPMTIAAVPFAAVMADRLIGFVLRSRPARVGAEVALGAVMLFLYGRPLSPVPYSDPTVTGVPPPEGTPDVILLSLDTTRADHLSLYGYHRDTTPTLKKLGEDALVFEQARSTAGWTLPGHSSMLTGLYPTRHGARAAGGWLSGQSVDGRRNVAFPLGDDKTTLAEVLRDYGFHTGGFVANFSYLYRSFGFSQGFQHYDDAPWRLLRFHTPVMHFINQINPTYFVRPYRTGHDINVAMLKWLDGTAPGRPVFAFMNYMDPHPPYLAPEPYTEWVKDLPFAKRLARKDLYSHEPRALTDEEREYIASSYDGQVRAADAYVGELIDALKQRGRYENALIIITSDHGTLLGEHDHVGHIGRMLYEGLLHIPLIVKFPGANRPRGRVATPVQNLDAFATALATVGLPVPAGTQGQALPNVTHPTLAEEDVNAFLVWRYGKEYDRAIRVLVEDQWKYIMTSTGDQHLFDMKADPSESTNLLTKDPARAEAMSKRLKTLLPFAGTGTAGSSGPAS